MRRRLIPLSAGLVVGLLLLSAGRGGAQPPKPDTVTFDTSDFVEIKGTLWPSNKGKKAPVAILLHRTGSKSSQDGWKELAEDLQKDGLAVLSFDFRGHGDSVNVGPKFWDMSHNKMHVRRRPGLTPPPTISFKDFGRNYWPYLINDIAAAKRFLERRYNDQGDLNLSNTILIGAEDGATLGGLWMSSEAHRFRLLPTGNKNDAPESRDVVACIWLSISNTLGPAGQGIGVTGLLPGWLRDAGNTRDSKVPMVFLYGKDDKAGDVQALRLVTAIKPRYQRGAKLLPNDELRATGDRAIPGARLQGAKLLTKELDTRQWITETYLPKLVFDEKKGLHEWEKRDPDKTPFIWDFTGGAGMRSWIPCNPGNAATGAYFNVGKVPNVVPLQQLRLTP